MANENNLIDTNKKAPEESFDTAGLLLDYLSHWKWFLLTVLICGGLAYYYCATIIPTYKVSAAVYLNDDNARKSEAISMSNNDPLVNMKTYIDETEIEILKSRNNILKIVDSLGLAYSYFQVGHLRDVPVYRTEPITAELDSMSLRNLGAPLTLTIEKQGKTYNIHSETNLSGAKIENDYSTEKLPHTLSLPVGHVTLRLSDVNPNLAYTEKIVIENPANVAGRISSNLDIHFTENAPTILNISLATPIVAQGKDIINTLIEFYNRQMLEDQNRSAIQTEAFILDRLAMISGELKDVEERLREYRQSHNISNIDVQTSMNLSQKSAAEEEIANVDAEIRIFSDAQSQIKQQGNNIVTIGAVTKNEAVNAEIQKYNTMVGHYEQLSRDLTDENERLVEARTKLQEQRSIILRTISSAENGLRQRRSGIASIGGASASQLSAQPTIDKGLQEIFREQSVKDNIYTFLLQKREEIALQKTLATPTAQLIDNPTGSGPVAPNRTLIIGIGILIGFLIPGLIIFIKRTVSPKFKDQEELARMTSVPIIGEICQDDTKEPIVVGKNVASPIAELFRLLRNNINFTCGGPEHKVILLTSTISGEGKTFVALNLAMTYALTDKRVLVIGLDIRRPVLAGTCGMTNERGVTTYLSGQANDINSLIQQSSFNENLYVLPAGPVPPNPNELLLSDRMRIMFDELRNEYDYIIVDSSPIGMISDTYLITQYSDIQIYVTRASYSTKKSLIVLHSAVKTKRLPHPYILLNDVDMNTSSYIYRRYGHYGYNASRTYGYGYGYGNNDSVKKKKGIFRRHNKK